MSERTTGWRLVASICQIVGLLLTLISLLHFDRFTMLVMFAIGLPLTGGGTAILAFLLIRRLPPPG